MGRGGIVLALIVAIAGALISAPLLLKASDYLRSYRPDPFRSIAARDDETTRLLGVGGDSLAKQSRRHALGTRPDHIKSLFHSAFVTVGGQHHHG